MRTDIRERRSASAGLDPGQFVDDLGAFLGGDYASAMKLLGVVVLLAKVGPSPFLGGKYISPRTYFRWLGQIEAAGWGELVADAELRRAVTSYAAYRFGGLPIPLARPKILEAVRSIVDEAEARSPQAAGRQASGAVKGSAEGRKAKPSALDGPADGGSLREATAPSGGVGDIAVKGLEQVSNQGRYFGGRADE